MKRIAALLCGVACLAAGADLTGCQDPGPAPVSDPRDPLVQQGEYYARMRDCFTCHQPERTSEGMLSGQSSPRPTTRAFGANLTPDPDTGIGGWQDDDIARALREGRDDQMGLLCPTMPRYPGMKPEEVKALIAFLRSIKPVHRVVPDSECPPIKPRPAPDQVDGGMDGGETRD